MRIQGFVVLAAAVLSAAMAFVAGCGSTQVRSSWRQASIDVTSADTGELQGALRQYADKHVMLAFVNDSDYLYIALTSDDRSLQRQILARGLTVWCDHAGGEDRRFGIHYPIGMALGMGGRERREEMGEGEEGDRQWELPMPDLAEAEIIGPMPDEHHQVRVMELHDIRMKLDNGRDGTISYRVRIPLMDVGRDPYAIGTFAGRTIGVGFEAGARVRPSVGDGTERSGREGGGGMGRRGGSGGYGRGGGFSPRGGGQREEPLQMWVQLQLAASDSTR